MEELTNLQLEHAFAQLWTESEKIGMRINKKKTQLLIISPPNGYVTSVRMDLGDGHLVLAVRTFKLVGFHFGSNPGVGTHVEELPAKFRRRVWMLYHPRRAEIRKMNLYRLYCVYVGSVIEYCSPVYHSLLNAGQKGALERLHRQVIRICSRTELTTDQIMEAEEVEEV